MSAKQKRIDVCLLIITEIALVDLGFFTSVNQHVDSDVLSLVETLLTDGALVVPVVDKAYSAHPGVMIHCCFFSLYRKEYN